MKRRVAAALVCVGLVAVVGAQVASAKTTSSGRLCNKGKWQGLVTSDGVEFQSQDGCTSYVQSGGTLFTDAQAPCLGGAHASLAKEDGDPFVDANDCLNYIADPENVLVHCTVAGTSASEWLTPTSAPDVFCGFGGTDRLGFGTTFATLSADDVYYGGPGGDIITGTVAGTFIGGDDDDTTEGTVEGVFIGGDGDDAAQEPVEGMFDGGAGNDYAATVAGRFLGGADVDAASAVTEMGIFYGGDGDDAVTDLYGVFSGDADDDIVGTVFATGAFYGGDGTDRAIGCFDGAQLFLVESACVG